jgi:hypothetical protein
VCADTGALGGPQTPHDASRAFVPHPFDSGCLPLSHSGDPGVNGVSHRGRGVPGRTDRDHTIPLAPSIRQVGPVGCCVLAVMLGAVCWQRSSALLAHSVCALVNCAQELMVELVEIKALGECMMGRMPPADMSLHKQLTPSRETCSHAPSMSCTKDRS